MLAENDELALLVERYRYRRADENSESEAIRLRYTLNILWGIYENAYFARGHNVLADQEWSRFEGRICAQYSRDISNGLWAERKIRLVEDFAEHVQALC